MDIRQLRYLLCIVDARGFTRAASVLHVAQSALTLQIQKLEQELGTQLLVRHARGVEPTPDGLMFLRRARQILDDVESTKHLFRRSAEHSESALVLGMVPMADVGLTASIVQRLVDEVPETTINVVEAIGPTVIDAVLNGKISVGLVHHISELPEEVASEDLHYEPFRFVTSADAPQLASDSIGFIEAVQRPLILPPAAHPLRIIVEQVAKQHNIRLTVSIDLHSLAGRIELVERNYGYSFLPHCDIIDRVAQGSLRYAAVHSPTLTRVTSLVYPIRKDYRAVEVRARDILRDAYRSWMETGPSQSDPEPN